MRAILQSASQGRKVWKSRWKFSNPRGLAKTIFYLLPDAHTIAIFSHYLRSLYSVRSCMSSPCFAFIRHSIDQIYYCASVDIYFQIWPNKFRLASFSRLKQEEINVTTAKRGSGTRKGDEFWKGEGSWKFFVVTGIFLCFRKRVEAGGDQCHQQKKGWEFDQCPLPMREAQPRGDMKPPLCFNSSSGIPAFKSKEISFWKQIFQRNRKQSHRTGAVFILWSFLSRPVPTHKIHTRHYKTRTQYTFTPSSFTG